MIITQLEILSHTLSYISIIFTRLISNQIIHLPTAALNIFIVALIKDLTIPILGLNTLEPFADADTGRYTSYLAISVYPKPSSSTSSRELPVVES